MGLANQLADHVSFTFWLTLLETACFGVIMWVWDFQILDEMYHAEEILHHIATLTPLQRKVHVGMTATLDVLYPLTYGSFFIGMSCKAFPDSLRKWLSALPAILCIPVDLVEGYAQVMLLNGHTDYIALKVTATPIKLALFILSVVIALVCAFRIKFGDTPKSRQD